MKKWEYRFYVESHHEKVLEELNALGEQGWEAVGVTMELTFTGILLKRQKLESSISKQSAD